MDNNLQKKIVPGVVSLGVALFLWYITPEQVPTRETTVFTARTFPHIALALVMVCSLGLILSGTFRIIRDRRKCEESGGETSPVTLQPRDILRVLTVLALLIFSAVTGAIAGLLPAGLIVGEGMLLIFGVRKKRHYLIVAIAVIVSYALFKYLFGLNLP